MKLFKSKLKRIQEKPEEGRGAKTRILEALEVENEKLQSGDLENYPHEYAYTEGLIDAYENCLIAIDDEINTPKMQ